MLSQNQPQYNIHAFGHQKDIRPLQDLPQQPQNDYQLTSAAFGFQKLHPPLSALQQLTDMNVFSSSTTVVFNNFMSTSNNEYIIPGNGAKLIETMQQPLRHGICVTVDRYYRVHHC